MATTKKTKTIIEETDPLEQPLESTKDETDVENFVSGLGPEVNRVTVYRLDSKTGKYAYCGALPPNNASEAVIQEMFGGGEFYVRLINAQGQFLRQKAVIVEPPRASVTSPGGIPSSPGPTWGQPTQFEMLQAQLARQQELILHLVDRKTEPTQENGLASIIKAVGTLQNLAAPQNQISVIVDALTKGIQLGMRTTTGPRAPEDKIGGILRIVESFKELLPRILPSPAAADPPPGPGPLETQPAGAPKANGGDTNTTQLIRGVVKYLKGKVSRDPGLWAEWIADNVDEKDWGQLAQLAEMPYSEICKLVGDPDLSREPFQSWFQQLLGDLKSILSEPHDTGNSDTQRAGGNPSRSGENGPAD